MPSLREGALVDGIFSQKWSQLIGEVGLAFTWKNINFFSVNVGF